jgi:hypothetical protein
MLSSSGHVSPGLARMEAEWTGVWRLECHIGVSMVAQRRIFESRYCLQHRVLSHTSRSLDRNDHVGRRARCKRIGIVCAGKHRLLSAYSIPNSSGQVPCLASLRGASEAIEQRLRGRGSSSLAKKAGQELPPLRQAATDLHYASLR